ncbi:MAG TPA: protein kinase [Nonomuraea sp.]|nr:protein kinase [Nonomuraea sp.]
MYGEGHWGVPGYTEVRELGSGAAGRVVLATRDHDGAAVAIKYLSDELRSDMGFVARFRHEARLLATLQSAHHARLIDYVESRQGAAIVMELVNGVSLRAIIKSEGPTGPEAALTVLKGSLLGLASAHAIGVVHRDFKPENVMVEDDGASKLVDFGIAVRAGEEAGAAGTPPYMAPEQWAGAPAAPATDVYAATAVFFECLTGTRPYRASTLAALAHQHQSAPIPVEEVPPALRGLVERGLAKNPAERPPTAEAFLTELEAVAAEGYGPDWEERGRRRLAALAGLLVLLFPKALDEPVKTHTSLAETRFGTPAGVLSRMSTKIAIGAVAVGVLVGAIVIVTVSSSGRPVLQAQTTDATPTPQDPLTEAPPETEEPSPTPEEPTQETTRTSPQVSTEEPAPAATPSDPVPTALPTRARPGRTVTPTPTPLRTPAKTRKPTPTETPEPGLTGEVAVPDSPRPAATPTPTRSSSAPTVRPTRPSPTPTRTESPTQSPTGGPDNPPTDDVPKIVALDAASGLVALGLMTSGAVPVTLARGRRTAGRQRRKS